jgi:hypothetical protein
MKWGKRGQGDVRALDALQRSPVSPTLRATPRYIY